MRVPRRLLLAAFGVFAGLLALEGVLQVIAYRKWTARETVASPPPGTRSVLCVGDSFTYGLGAVDRENAYPAVAQRTLADLPGEPVHCVNLGWPGQNSADVLARLPDELARVRPQLVYVLVGYNDFWSAHDVGDGEGDGFPFECRTLKLFRMIGAALGGGPPADGATAKPQAPQQPATDAPFLGPWHTGPVFLDFRADGTIDTAEGPFDGVWSLRGERLVVEMRETGAVIEATYRIVDEHLVIEGGPFGRGLVLERGLPSATAYERGRIAMRAGDHVGADAAWREALADPAQAFDARLALAALCAERGARGDAQELLDAAEPAAAASAGATIRYSETALAIGDVGRAFARIVAAVDVLPIDGPFASFIVRHVLRAPDRPALDGAIAARLARSDLATPVRQALLGVRISLDVDPNAAFDALVEIASYEPPPAVFERTVRQQRAEFPRDAFVAHAAKLAPDARARAIAAYDRAAAVEDRTADVLTANLTAIVAACRRSGAEPVLMTYPGSREDVARTVRATATALGVGLVDHLAEFAERFAGTPREALYISDGHCNDRGYTLMGERVAADVRTRLR